MAKIGIVICNYNKQNDVIDCIQSVLESKYEDYHIYVVDNASTDESVRLIRECYASCDRLTLIENSENLGGSGGFNTGLRVAMAEENFLYWDDTEWCVRCREAGYEVASVGAAAASHAMGAKKEDINTFPTYYAWRNWIKFFLDHIDEERLSDMAETFLGSIFEINYTGLYRGEENRSKTVMAALDDALHKVMGKAKEDRIFNLELTYDGLERAIGDKSDIAIIAGEFPLYADALKEKIKVMWPDKRVYIVGLQDTDEAYGTAHFQPDATITICESIFRQDDLSLSTYVMDLDGNVLVDGDDVLMVINYNFSRRSFLFSMKPLFMRLSRQNYGF